MKKQEKGITLVALVITIIILLILAGITINSLIGSGLFEKTKLTKEKYKNSELEENEILGKYENEIEKVAGATRDLGNGTELYKLNNFTWQAVPVAEMNYDVTKYKVLRIDFVSCWADNSVECNIIGNIWIEPNDLNVGFTYSHNFYNWWCENVFKFEDNSIIINRSSNWCWSGSHNENQTVNIYRVLGYN